METSYVISPPKFATIDLYLEGIAPLVVERFSKKAELMAKMQEGPSSKSKKVRDARDYEKEAEDARYRSMEGWEGMNAAAFRAAMISACRLVGFKMTWLSCQRLLKPMVGTSKMVFLWFVYMVRVIRTQHTLAMQQAWSMFGLAQCIKSGRVNYVSDLTWINLKQQM